MPEIHCRHFSGYKPCGLYKDCNEVCPHRSIPTLRVLVIGLEAMGAVLRATSLLPAIHRQWKGCHVTWLTKTASLPLLQNNPLIDRAVSLDEEGLLELEGRHFHKVLSIDKSKLLSGLLNRVTADEIRGFFVDAEYGCILPANPEADELWQLGLSNEQKFYVNKKPETQLMCEALALGPWKRDSYVLKLTDEERKVAQLRHKLWGQGGLIIGINTGCSGVIPYKKLTVKRHRQLVIQLQNKFPGLRIVLLGGPEDTQRNKEIGRGLADVIQSPTMSGLRDGLCSVAACDFVITGDSLGMHMAIALGKWTVAWFGPTCGHEIDLYDNGVKVLADVACGPCWKRICDRSTMCYDQVSLDKLIDGVKKGLDCKYSSSRQPLSEISF